MSLFRQPYDADGWFRIGKLQVTTTLGILLLSVAGTVLSAFARSLLSVTALTPISMFGFQAWRLFTWPWVDAISFWTVLTWLFFYMFGTYVENTLGRKTSLKFYAGLWGIITASYLLFSLVLPAATPVFGLSLIQLLVVLVFIANAPKGVTFMGLPAWVLGLIFVGLQLLMLIQIRDFAGIGTLLISLAGTAIWAKSLGLLTDATWLPIGNRGTTRRSARKPASPSGRPGQPTRRPVSASDEQRLDELLDKVSREGLHALSPRERRELEKISKKRRQ